MTVIATPPQIRRPAVPPAIRSAADVAAELGVPPERLVVNPAPGTATEEDCARCERPTELIDGTLVEKPVNNFSSGVATRIANLIQRFADDNAVDVHVTGGDGSYRMVDRNLRLPDVAVTPDERLAGDPHAATPSWLPDLAVEVLSPSNTRREMADKRAEYFASGVAEVWEIDPVQRTGRVYRGDECVRVLGADDAFDCESLLPGFSMRLADPIEYVERKFKKS